MPHSFGILGGVGVFVKPVVRDNSVQTAIRRSGYPGAYWPRPNLHLSSPESSQKQSIQRLIRPAAMFKVRHNRLQSPNFLGAVGLKGWDSGD